MNDDSLITFLPWLRRGVCAKIGRRDNSSNLGPRADFQVELGFNSQTGGQPSFSQPVTISLYGPGEIKGLDTQVIINAWPKPNVVNVEANYFPMIEFGQADLPWRYTPASSGRPEQDRLKPWLCLITLRDDEFELSPAGPERLLPQVTVTEAAKLPDLDQSGAWAHIHVSGHEVSAADRKADDQAVAGVLASDPHCLTSRLLSPRRLDDLTNYTSFLVPAFERGRLAGLGLAVGDEVDALEKAWHPIDKLVQLPVYHMWSFRTGPMGDFEYLATLLKPCEIGSEMGFKKMDVSHPGLSLPSASEEPMNMDGALISTEVADPWIAKGDFVHSLVEVLNRPDDYLKKETSQSVVAPPIYGNIHASRNRLPAPKTDKPEAPPDGDRRWLWQININPARRVAAGLGTRVIQANQQQLMASAWKQADGIRRANREIRFAQLSMEVSASSYRRHILSQDAETAIFVTTPLHNRVVVANSSASSSTHSIKCCPPKATAGARIRSSPISKGCLEPQWRRRASPLGNVGRRQGRTAQDVKQPFLKRMAKGELTSSSPPEPPSSTISFSTIDKNIIKSPHRGLVPEGSTPDRSGKTAPSALDDVLAIFETKPEAGTLGEFQDDEFDGLCNGIVADLEPRRNIAASIRKRLTMPPEPEAGPEEPDEPRIKIFSHRVSSPADETDLKPVMQAPEFLQPMYEALRDLSQDWFLPGVEKLPENSISLLMANQHFIEAFMVGLNHEMARELLWNGYPTDQKGTSFRQFWNSTGVISEPRISTEEQKDINNIVKWENNELGDNTSRRLTAGDPLVLVIRGELLKRYPNTIIYAAKANKKDEVWTIEAEEKHPIFSGTLVPDISFFGFDLDKNAALEGDGWFFVLQEQPSEPRFGLDVANEENTGKELNCWKDISWGHLVDRSEDLQNLVYIDLKASRPKIEMTNETTTDCKDDPGLGLNWHDGGSSDIAYITYQRPVRVAVHARRMLLNN